MNSLFGKHYFQILKYKYIWFSLSGVVLIISIVGLAVFGLNFGVDFTGGTELDIQCKKGTSIADVRSSMGEVGYSDAKIQSAGGSSYIIRTSKLTDEEKKEVTEALKQDGVMTELLGLNDIGPGWGAIVSRQALIGFIIFLIAILIYISLRFEFKMAICAIIALFHDLVITIGVYAFLGREVTPATVIAVLTIMGYSLYDTIVIFDRVKEDADQLTRQSKKTYSDSVNDSINETLARSINTSITTLIPIVTILLFGGTTLKDFAFALFLGVTTGTYSSIFVASQLLAIWKEREPKYQAYQERMKRREARRERVTADVAEAGPQAKTVTQAGKAKAGPAQAAMKKEAKPSPQAPKPKAPPAGQGAKKTQAGAKPAAKKSSAKARTKGPGSGKKKKKKR